MQAISNILLSTKNLDANLINADDSIISLIQNSYEIYVLC